MVKIGFVGSGRIGQTIIASTLMDGFVDDSVIFDIAPEVPQRFADEMRHSLAEARLNTRVLGTNDINDVKDCDVVVISAGKPRKADQDRTAVFAENAKVMMDFASKLPKSNPNALFLMVTNPVDMMASIFMKYSGRYTISSGAQVEIMRMRSFIADKLGVPVDSVNGFTGGEHGVNLSIFWDTVTVYGKSFDEAAKGKLTRDEVTAYVKGVAAKIIGTLGGTSWGPANSMKDIIKAYVRNENKVMSIAPPMEYKGEIIHISRPTVVGNPIGPTLEASLSEEDRKEIASAADRVYNDYKELLKTLG